ncbi:GntR family transcriptional regulator [Cohnella thermotolerans]|uniref:GntR family transcriptional regulator n=1 Tax=Cohnella thermotolerans TaxID=329858 RepID=UPI0003FE9DE2|nr:GntR family transcriptional regulator [Cohnella thermotolerans]
MAQEVETEIYKAIKQAIIEQKLRPGMQLVEEVIAESFGVSRTPVRGVFRRLASEKLVSIIPYKGAFVACPTVLEAMEVFEMRRVIEAAAVRNVCRTLTDPQYDVLKKLLAEEEESQKRGDLFGAIQVTGDFHLRIAEFSGNSYFYRCLEELLSLTYVIMALYGEQKVKCCQDHERILAAIRERDLGAAERLTLEHLRELEETLDFGRAQDSPKSLADIFRPERLIGSRE